ncbi:NAD(P)-dependent oxidoreductase [Lentzea aerocolonigenes]|uniref:NAD(P)-dependent oxidoreductase n=1 Tax=Lentzea aerocolonigenes TaxID=68170 RepID=UPI0004C41BDD|nr:NAD(P)-dependent oxidoreductase [Lentzea aerocolonigenes]
MTRIAFLGLGRMGALMATRLVAAGHDLTVWNRTADKTAPLVEAGATAAGTPAEAVAGAELVISMLFGPDAVREVYANAVEALKPGTIVVEMSTIGPQAVAELKETLPDGVRLIDAPVKGSLPAASSGELGIYAGAADADLADAADVLAVLGKVKHVGPTGAGASVKLLVNLVLGSSFVMVAEALALADSLGVETDAALTALEGTAVGSLIPRVRAKLENPGSTQFSLGLAEKDLRLVLDAGGVANGVAAGAQEKLAAAAADGLAENDISAVLNHVRGK